MKFEEHSGEGFNHELIFEAGEDEVEPVAATYRENVKSLVQAGEYDKITRAERIFSKWDNGSNLTIYTNKPIHIAMLLERFSERTQTEVEKIAKTGMEPAFDDDSIARRMDLGHKALQLAGLIKLEFDSDTIQLMLDEQGIDLFTDFSHAPKNPHE